MLGSDFADWQSGGYNSNPTGMIQYRQTVAMHFSTGQAKREEHTTAQKRSFFVHERTSAITDAARLLEACSKRHNRFKVVGMVLCRNLKSLSLRRVCTYDMYSSRTGTVYDTTGTRRAGTHAAFSTRVSGTFFLRSCLTTENVATIDYQVLGTNLHTREYAAH
jgi:hypothetical protein